MPLLPNYQVNIPDLEAEIFLRSNIIGKLHDGQKELRGKFLVSTARKTVFNCARRFGKSTLLAAIAVEHCLRNPKARVVYAAPTRAQAKDIILPIMRDMFDGAPKPVIPAYRVQDMMYVFANGAELHVDGADDDQGNHLRGPKATLVLCDEAGFWRYCHYVINSILLPQTITCDGRIIVASTPPQSVGHEFMGYVAEAQESNAYVVKTIYDNPMLTVDKVEEYAKESGGKESTTFRREYLCEFVTESERAVVPEFNDTHIIDNYTRPDFYDAYVFMDLGLVDYTHVLFAYYDFLEAKLIIEDEVVTNFKTTADLAECIKEKEATIWGRNRKPHMRISDNDMQQLTDLSVTHNLHFSPAAKHDKEAAINQLRTMFQSNRIAIYEGCKQLIFQLKVGIWNQRRTDYERIPGAGHLDGIDALKYGVRLVDYNRNPVPIGSGTSRYTHHIPSAQPEKHPLERLVNWYGGSK